MMYEIGLGLEVDQVESQTVTCSLISPFIFVPSGTVH